MSQIRKVINMYYTGGGNITIPIRLIRALNWKDRESLYLIIYSNKVIIVNELPRVIDELALDIFKTNLIKSKNHGTYLYTIVFNKEITEMLQLNKESNKISIDLEENKIIVTKL